MVKNTHFFYTLPRLSARPIFWVFTHRSVFWGILVVILEQNKHFQKLDTQRFPTIHHGPHFDIGKASKSCQKVKGLSADVFFEYFCKNWTFQKWLFFMCVWLFLYMISYEKSIYFPFLSFLRYFIRYFVPWALQSLKEKIKYFG